MPLELIQAMFIGMDPPKHDRLKALFQRGFTPKRIAEHEDAIREITIDVLDRLEGRETCDLVTDVAQPVVSRVIGSFMGIPPEDDDVWARLMNNTLGAGDREGPEGTELIMQEDVPEIFERCRKLIAERRENPTDDLTSVLVHAEVDGERLEEHEIVMGFFLLMAAGNDSTKATYCSGMRALIENPERAREAARRPVADPERGRGVAADVPGVRPLPPHRDRGRRAERRSRSARATRWSCGTCRRTATRRATRIRTASTSSATPSTRRSAPAGGTSASAPRWPGSSCNSCSRRR